MRVTVRRPLAALLVLLAPAAAVAQGTTSRHTLGANAQVYNLVGTMRVEPATGTSVEVEVTRQGSEGEKLRVETGEVRGRPTLRVMYPSDQIRWQRMGRRSSTTVTVSEDGTFGGGRASRRVRVSSDEGMDAYADLVVRVPSGATVGVRLAVGEAIVSNVRGNLNVDVSSATVRASGVRGTLEIDTGSGSVSVSDQEGRLLVDAGSGNTTLENVRGDQVTVDAGSGNVTGRGIRARKVLVDVGSGSTRLTEVTADDLTVDTGSGTVDVSLTNDASSVLLDTGSGSVTLRVPADFGATLDVDTGSGGIESEIPITITRRSRSSLIGTIGDGRGRVKIDTGSGSVSIVRS